MKNKIILILGIVLSLFVLSGCSKDEVTTSMTAYTSVYPVEYILENLYGDNVAIYSVYPDGTNYKNYNLTKKQLSDYSKGDLFVYSGTIKKEKDYAVSLLNNNKKIKIIDASLGMNYSSDPAENWLNPANFLMMSSNIKKGLEEYISEKIEKDKINKNYEELKLSLSEIDAELKQIASSSSNPVLVVSSDTFKYLEKYGFTIYSLEENSNLSDKTIADVKKLLANKQISYIFLKDNEEENNTIKDLKNNYEFKTVSINTISTLSASDRKDKKDYISIMMDNINSIKLEVND